MFDAAAALLPHIVRTPVLRSDQLDDWAGGAVWAKAECLQRTGSFKVRGALNRVRTLSSEARHRGLITVSAGNAALGTAFAAQRYGAPLTVVMPAAAIEEKRKAVARLGAIVVTEGITDSSSAFDRARQLQADGGLMFVHPYDDPMVIAGAATATLGLLQDHPDLSRIYVPTSGGGLLSGAVLARQALDADVELVGVQPVGFDGMVRSLHGGGAVPATSATTVADGLTAPAPGRLNLEMIAAAGVRVRTVFDKDILAAMAVLVGHLRVVTEPSGATALAGMHADVAEIVDAPAGPVGVLVSGSNVSWTLLTRVMQRAESEHR